MTDQTDYISSGYARMARENAELGSALVDARAELQRARNEAKDNEVSRRFWLEKYEAECREHEETKVVFEQDLLVFQETEGELSATRKYLNDLHGKYDRLEDEFRRVKAELEDYVQHKKQQDSELAELRQDKERLDWIQRNGATLFRYADCAQCWECNEHEEIYLRAAIDAAMKGASS